MLNKKKSAFCLSVSKSALFTAQVELRTVTVLCQTRRLTRHLVQHTHNLIHQQQVYK